MNLTDATYRAGQRSAARKAQRATPRSRTAQPPGHARATAALDLAQRTTKLAREAARKRRAKLRTQAPRLARATGRTVIRDTRRLVTLVARMALATVLPRHAPRGLRWLLREDWLKRRGRLNRRDWRSAWMLGPCLALIGLFSHVDPPAGAVLAAVLYAASYRPRRRAETKRKLTKAVAKITGDDHDSSKMVRKARWHKGRLVEFKLHYSEQFRDGEQAWRERVERSVAAKLGKPNLPALCAFTWHTAGNIARVKVGVNLPTKVWLELDDRPAWNEIVVGINETGPELWDLRTCPHALFTSSTGAGKTNLMRVVSAQLLSSSHPWNVYACDPKRIELHYLRGMPGVNAVRSTVDGMVNLVVDVARQMDAWYEATEAGENPAPLWIMLFVDEVAELVERCTDDRFRKALASILRLGRRARIHVCMATQRPDTEYVPGEARSNVKYRVATGPLDQAGSMMVFGDAKVGQPLAAGGRCLSDPGRVLISDNGMFRDVQAFYVADPVYLNPDIPERTARSEQKRAAQLFPLPVKRVDSQRVDDPDQGPADQLGGRRMRKAS